MSDTVYPSGTKFDETDPTQNHWKGGWKYRVGDVVHHREHKILKGVIVRQKFDWEVEADMDQGEPWYEIMWVVGLDDENYPHEGQEHEGQLVLIHQYNPL